MEIGGMEIGGVEIGGRGGRRWARVSAYAEVPFTHGPLRLTPLHVSVTMPYIAPR